MSKITFNVAGEEDEKTIFSWLAEPHMVEYWDNSQEHKDDISNFIHGRKQLYFAGTTKYFMGRIDNVPFAFILGDIIDADENLSALQKKVMSKFGNTVSVDFGIGNKDYIGKGLASKLLFYSIKKYREGNLLQLKATIKKENIASIKIFKKCDFVQVDENDMCFFLKNRG